MEEQNTAAVKNPQAGKGLGVTSLILGIFGFILCFIPIINWFGILLAITSVILGAIGLSVAKKNGGSIGMAIVGLILGGIGIIVFIVMYALIFSAASAPSYSF